MDGKRRAGAAVADRRGELGMTQKQLADESGVAERTIGSLERGIRWPNARNRARIDTALGWPAGELHRIATREDERPRHRPVSDELRRLIVEHLPDVEDQRWVIGILEGTKRRPQAGESQTQKHTARESQPAP